MITLNKKRILIILGILVVISGFFLFKKILVPAPKLLEISPNQNAKEVSLMPEIILTFNKNVSPKQITFSSTPFYSYIINTDSPSPIIKFIPQETLKPNTTYKIDIKFSFGGDFSWEFTTTQSQAGAVPGWAEAFNKQEQEYLKNNPLEEVNILNNLIDQMPYFTSFFWVEYFSKEKTFIAHLCQEPYEDTKKSVMVWFNEQDYEKLIKLKPGIEWYLGCEPPLKTH